MPELETPAVETPAAPPEAPPADPWTSDSERHPVQEGASTETPEAVAEPDAPAAPKVARDETGKFTAEQPKAKKPRNDPEARVTQATAKEAIAKEEARQAREEAAQLKARLAALETSRQTPRAEQASPAPSSAAFPDFGTYTEKHPEASYEDYIDARTDARIAAANRSQASEQQETTRRAAHAARMQATAAAEPDFEASLPQWDAALAQAGVHEGPGGHPLTQVMQAAILDSSKGPQIMRWLGTHPQDALQLARETARVSLDAVPVMRRYLETAVGAVPTPDSASTVIPSAAKAPINRVGGTASATPVDPDDLDFGPEYMRLQNERDKKAGRRW